MVLKKYVEV